MVRHPAAAVPSLRAVAMFLAACSIVPAGPLWAQAPAAGHDH